MNIFLDSNILYSDPFFQDNFSRKFLDTIKEANGKIFMSSVVYQEVLNNYKRELKKRRRAFGEGFYDLNKLLLSKFENTFKGDDYYLDEIEKYYRGLIDSGYIEIISHTEFDMFNEIVERALNNKKPFDYQKEEFKDTVIWLSYAKYVESKKIKGFFLSNNTKEFYSGDKKSLHPDLFKDTQRLTPYKSIENFMTSEKDFIQEQIRLNMEEEQQLEILFEWARKNLRKRYVESLISENFIDKLQNELSYYVDNLSGMDLNRLTQTPDDYSKAESLEVLKVKLSTYEREFYVPEIVIYGSLDVNHYISLYAWNSFRDKGEDPYFHVGTDTIYHTVEFTFTIDINFQAGNFEVKDIETKLNNSHINSDNLANPEDVF
jgi:PIN domain